MYVMLNSRWRAEQDDDKHDEPQRGDVGAHPQAW